MLGVIIATVIAMLLRRWGAGTGLTLLASSAGLLIYLTIVFQPGHSFYGLPTPEVVRGLWRAISNAYDHSRVDYAPVPVRTGYVVLTVSSMWVAATLGEIATFRWRRPLFATLIPIGMFSLIMVVGTQTGSGMFVILFLTALLLFWALESAHRLRSWGRWVPTWPDRPDDDSSPIAAGIARRMGVTCIVAALSAPLFLPALGDSLLSWRIDAGAGGPGVGGAGGRIDPFVSMKPQLIEQTEAELFSVRSDKPTYWKLVTLSEFDGERWYPNQGPVASIPPGGGNVTQGQLPQHDLGRQVVQYYELSGLRGEFLPAAVVPGVMNFVEDVEGVRSNLQTGDVSLVDGISGSLDYEVFSIVPNASFQQLREAEVVRFSEQGPVPFEYYLLPEDTSPEITRIAERWTRGRETDTDKLISIQNHLRGFTYDLAVDAEASDDYLLQFLTETKRGYCQQFSTAFAALARSLGYPARVAVGFLPGETSPEDPNSYVVRGTDAHAWPEVYYEGYGWVAFEPTPRGEAIPPRYTTRPQRGLPGGGGGFSLDPNAQIRALNRQPDGFGFLPPENRGVPSARRTRGPRPEPLWIDAFAALAGVLAVLVVGSLVLIPLLKIWLIRRRYLRARDAGELAAAAFAEFQMEAGELVDRRKPSESAVSYALRIASLRDVPQATALSLARIYEASQYAPSNLPSQQGAEARKLARVLRNTLWRATSWWERLVRLFYPRLRLGR